MKFKIINTDLKTLKILNNREEAQDLANLWALLNNQIYFVV